MVSADPHRQEDTCNQGCNSGGICDGEKLNHATALLWDTPGLIAVKPAIDFNDD